MVSQLNGVWRKVDLVLYYFNKRGLACARQLEIVGS